MSKVTKKLQVSVPKALAERYGIAPGDDLRWEAAGDVLRVIPPGRQQPLRLGKVERLRLFDASTQRQQERQMGRQPEHAADRGWRREDLYERHGRPD